MKTTNLIRKDLAKVFLYTLLAFFLLPTVALLFVQHAQPEIDGSYLQSIESQIEQDKRLDLAAKQRAKAFYRANPPSSVCANSAPDMADYREGVCAPLSDLWQFHMVGKVSLGTILLGAGVFLIVCILGAAAFANRRAQYLSFIFGWRLLTVVSAVEVIVQGALAVWLSFWLTAFFFELYSIKLIVLIGIGAAIAMFYAVVCIFQRAPADNAIDGELVSEDDAPGLWSNIRALAARLNTAPPDQIIAGIDTNFFVTETPLTVSGKTVTGRSLFVSIPLLRLLDKAEADAVLAHELAHLRGGDTASSAALGPKLVQYDHYCYMMRANGVTILVYYLMRMYRVIFEFALKRDSRDREFLADRTAADAVSPSAIAQALIKISAYGSYRARIERTLFQYDQQHGDSLGIARSVACGLEPYVRSSEFAEAMKTADVPHPFDTHPSMTERMKNVGYEADQDSYGQLITSSPATTWASDIRTAAEIEQRLWTVYEEQFAAAHEQSLAYRYEPANDVEQAVVLKYFPPIVFELKGGKSIQVTYAGPVLPNQSTVLSWDSVSDLKYDNGIGGDVLEISHPEKGWLGAKTTKVKLPGIKNQREQLKSVLGQYWQRHQIMRREQLAKGAA